MLSKGFLGGIACGAVIGAAIGMLADPINDKQHRKMRSSANHMFKTIGTVIDGIMEVCKIFYDSQGSTRNMQTKRTELR